MSFSTGSSIGLIGDGGKKLACRDLGRTYRKQRRCICLLAAVSESTVVHANHQLTGLDLLPLVAGSTSFERSPVCMSAGEFVAQLCDWSGY